MTPAPVEQAQVAGLPRHVVGVAGVVIDEQGRALTVQRREPRRWELPGGALELGETLLDGLRREVREEIGLAVEPVRLTGAYQNMSLGPVALVFWCRATGGSERLSEETVGYRWIDRAAVYTLLPPAWATRFTDAMDAWSAATRGRLPGSAPVRVHDGTNLLSGGLESVGAQPGHDVSG